MQGSGTEWHSPLAPSSHSSPGGLLACEGQSSLLFWPAVPPSSGPSFFLPIFLPFQILSELNSAAKEKEDREAVGQDALPEEARDLDPQKCCR